ncbi:MULTISPECIES: hypothetical protein [unclassified Bradyrhizobium]|uniref:hypothetical protein n=1 Tax=unclassified Bradyrhizobium TaxID=2631580 RepID=UPI00115F81C4|nr:hypothetical protein [Bradyrhizobium sp. Rc2d]
MTTHQSAFAYVNHSGGASRAPIGSLPVGRRTNATVAQHLAPTTTVNLRARRDSGFLRRKPPDEETTRMIVRVLGGAVVLLVSLSSEAFAVRDHSSAFLFSSTS